MHNELYLVWQLDSNWLIDPCWSTWLGLGHSVQAFMHRGRVYYALTYVHVWKINAPPDAAESLAVRKVLFDRAIGMLTLGAGEESTPSQILRSMRSVATERAHTGAAPAPDSPRKTCRCLTPKNQKPADQGQLGKDLLLRTYFAAASQPKGLIRVQLPHQTRSARLAVA